MKRHYFVYALACIVGLIGIVSLFGVVLWSEEASIFLRICTAVNGIVLVGAAVLLQRRQRVAATVLLISAAIYFISMVGPVISQHGADAFQNLIPAFYFSLAERLLVAALAYGLLLPVQSHNGRSH